MTPDGRPLAEFSDRLMAWLIDGAILFGVTLVLMVPAVIGAFLYMTGRMPDPGDTGPGPDPFQFILPMLLVEAALIVVMLGVRYLYDVQFMYRSGQTVGKRVMKIQVVRLGSPEPLTRGVATKRWLISVVAASFVPFLSYLDGLWQLWDKPFRQCLHDRYAETVVVKVAG